MDVLARNWGWVALRGIVALIFGVLTFFNPAMSLAALVIVFGAYSFVDGILWIVAAIANRHGEPHWVALLIGGVVGIAVGVITFFLPGLTALALLYCIAAWALITGAAGIAAAIRLRKAITGEWLLALAGVLSMVFGLLLFFFPGAGALAVILWIGAYAIVFGVVLLSLALRLRRWGRERGSGATPQPA